MLLCSCDTHHLFANLFRIPYRLCRAAEIPVQGGDHNIAVIHHPPIPQTNRRLGVNTVQLCRERDISINKLCTMSGVTQSTVNNIVSGRNKSVTISTIKKLCDGLDMPIEDFFKSDLFKGLEQEIK